MTNTDLLYALLKKTERYGMRVFVDAMRSKDPDKMTKAARHLVSLGKELDRARDVIRAATRNDTDDLACGVHECEGKADPR